MREELSTAELIKLLEKMCLDMESSQEKLQELDARAGDGDLGISVKLGFRAVRENLLQLADKDIGTILIRSGTVFNKAGASTFGTLMATAFMRAGREVKGKREIGLNDISLMMRCAIKGIKERGKASEGECTMLDALTPAEEMLKECSDKGQPLNESMAMAAEAAEKGAESTIVMKAKHGRAGWLAEKSLGIPDAGAIAIALILRSISQYLEEKCR